jgi:hypothetical protein
MIGPTGESGIGAATERLRETTLYSGPPTSASALSEGAK